MKSLFNQTQFANLKLKNRAFRSATVDGMADEEGRTTKALFEVYEKLAKGEIGTIITGMAYVTDLEQPSPGQMGIYNDSFIGDYKKLTGIIHQYDANIILQLAALGSQTLVNKREEKVMWGPSAVEDIGYKTTPQEMTLENIRFIQTAFADAAYRAKEAGFDGIQMHAAHGYMLSKFLTPYYNRRTDVYGGIIENRARMIIETYQAIRAKVGNEYPILIKINAEDFLEQGMTFEECKYVCKKLSQLGIDGIEISGGTFSSRPNEGPARKMAKGQESYFKDYAAEIAQDINAPVIVVGGHRTLETLDKLLNETPIQYIAFCRPLICESNLIERWQNGDVKPAKCISCNKCFLSEGIANLGGVSCIFNRK
jgi:2,4-dienoyl-CoA reductase-like NADH-dependent reductase (Old Yellow Enzyme family)